MRIFRTVLFVFTLLLCAPTLADPMEINGFQFENPLGKASTTELGRGVMSAHWPGDKPYKEAQAEIIVVNLGPSTVETMAEGGGNVYDAVLASMMGLFIEPEEINKTLFMGSTSSRQVYNSSVPRKHVASVFSKNLEDGSFVLVGVRSYDPANDGAGKLIQSIANTFKKAPK